MAQAKGTVHHLTCRGCNRKMPRSGYRAGLCAKCAKAAISAAGKGRLAEAVHRALPHLPLEVAKDVRRLVGLQRPDPDSVAFALSR